jgi:outer membrane protein assembly factor BamB
MGNVLLAFLAGLAPEGQDEAGEILRLSGVASGLCVRVGATDGALEAALADGGRLLVHGLTLGGRSPEEARRRLQSRGLYGLVSVEAASTLDPLPYADNLVNLLVADASTGGLSKKEVLRVLAPGGVACLRKDGAWEKTVKPWPADYDDWTHFDYGPEGNGVSHDRAIRPATFVQWSFSGQPAVTGGNPAGYRVLTGFRVAGGRAFFEWTPEGEKGKGDREVYYTARDAFNGLPVWTLRHAAGLQRKEWQFVASKDRLYAFLEKAGPAAAIDAATGKVVRTFDPGGRLTETVNQTGLRLCGGTLLQTAGDTLTALDAASGALRWQYREDDALLLFPSASAADDRVFAAVGDPQNKGHYSRWPFHKLKAVVGLELSSGKRVWRNEEVAGGDIGQLVYAEGSLALFGSGAIGGGKEPYVGLIRAGDGRLLWHSTFRTEYNRFGYNLLVRDGVLCYADAWRIYAHDLKTGVETRPFDDGGYNMRCNRFCATDDTLIYGYVAYVDRQWGGLYQSVGRGGCAQGIVPAHGMVYLTPNTCRCFAMLRGHMALSSEPVREPWPEARRLEKGSAAPAPVPEGGAGPPAGPVAEEWHRQRRVPKSETEPVTSEGRTFVAVVHEHRLEARDPQGRALWSFTAGGRISSPPVVQEGLCFFGSHDGWVYAVRASDGALAWRFLAAPYERRMAVDGQLESSWPVYGVVLHDGLVCASAGLHPEVGGGIRVYGLEPGTGAVGWSLVLRRSPVPVEAKNRKPVVPNRVLNDALRSEGGELVLPGIRFVPREPGESLRRKLEEPLPRKK